MAKVFSLKFESFVLVSCGWYSSCRGGAFRAGNSLLCIGVAYDYRVWRCNCSVFVWSRLSNIFSLISGLPFIESFSVAVQ